MWYENTCFAWGVVNKVLEGESVEIGQVDTGGLGMASIGAGLLPGKFSVGKRPDLVSSFGEELQQW